MKKKSLLITFLFILKSLFTKLLIAGLILLALIALVIFVLYRHQQKEEPTPTTTPAHSITQASEPASNQTFTCVQESFPELPSDADKLYQYAVYHDSHNRNKKQEQQEPWATYLPYYRIAAANGHWKANLVLQRILRVEAYSGELKQISNEQRKIEAIRLNQILMKSLPATAQYHLLKINNGSLADLRKVAELGSAQAQRELGVLLLKEEDKRVSKYEKVLHNHEGITMLQCATTQTFPDGIAATEIARRYMNSGQYENAKPYLYAGIKGGNPEAASLLWLAFKSDAPYDTKHGRTSKDDERANRYHKLYFYLHSVKHYPGGTITGNIHDLDDIAPLPPVPLPEWDGQTAIQRFVNGSPPPKPDDELMHRLAENAGLDNVTGLPK